MSIHIASSHLTSRHTWPIGIAEVSVMSGARERSGPDVGNANVRYLILQLTAHTVAHLVWRGSLMGNPCQGRLSLEVSWAHVQSRRSSDLINVWY